MTQIFETNNGNYISAKEAAEIYGYTSDYLGQLARAGKIKSKLVGHTRLLEEESLKEYVEGSRNGGKGNEISTSKPLNKNTSRVNEISQESLNIPSKTSARPLKIIDEGKLPLRPVPVKILSKRLVADEEQAGSAAGPVESKDSVNKVAALIIAAVLVVGSYTFVTAGSSISSALRNFAIESIQVEKSITTNATAGVLDSLWGKLSSLFVRTKVFTEEGEPGTETPVLVNENSGVQGDGEGIVVLPTSGDQKTDEETIEGIKRTFSDEVTVSLDEDGLSGLIKPIFKDRTIDQSYLYVLVPVEDE